MFRTASWIDGRPTSYLLTRVAISPESVSVHQILRKAVVIPREGAPPIFVQRALVCPCWFGFRGPSGERVLVSPPSPREFLEACREAGWEVTGEVDYAMRMGKREATHYVRIVRFIVIILMILSGCLWIWIGSLLQ